MSTYEWSTGQQYTLIFLDQSVLGRQLESRDARNQSVREWRCVQPDIETPPPSMLCTPSVQLIRGKGATPETWWAADQFQFSLERGTVMALTIEEAKAAMECAAKYPQGTGGDTWGYGPLTHWGPGELSVERNRTKVTVEMLKEYG